MREYRVWIDRTPYDTRFRCVVYYDAEIDRDIFRYDCWVHDPRRTDHPVSNGLIQLGVIVVTNKASTGGRSPRGKRRIMALLSLRKAVNKARKSVRRYERRLATNRGCE